MLKMLNNEKNKFFTLNMYIENKKRVDFGHISAVYKNPNRIVIKNYLLEELMIILHIS